MSQVSLEELLQQVESNNPDVRRNATWLLGRFRDERIVAPLVRRLGDADATVRARAAEALGTRREVTVVSPLVEALGDADANVRRLATRSLGLVGHGDAIAPLIELLGDADDTVRSQASESVAELAQSASISAEQLEEAVAPLCQMLVYDGDANVRYYATSALQAIASPTVTTHLIEALKLDLNVTSLQGVIELMGKMASSAFRPHIAPYAEHADPDIAFLAEWALERIDQGDTNS